MLKRRLKEPFGKAGLTVAILALVMALVGGAYAAGGLTKSQEKQVTKIAKKYAGKPGATGATGATGPAGTNGTNGKDGTNGTNGANGTGAEAISFSGALHGCTEGGIEVKSASATTFLCNGAKGTNGTNGKTLLNGTGAPSNATGTEGDFYLDTAASKLYGPKGASTWPGSGTSLVGPPGPEGVCATSSCHLPTNVTEKGTWSISQFVEKGFSEGGFEFIEAPISFNIPLAAGLDENHVHFIMPAETPPTGCTGTVTNPGATSGNLCVFAQEIGPTFFSNSISVTKQLGVAGEFEPGANPFGGVIRSVAENKGQFLGAGSWAVTG